MDAVSVCKFGFSAEHKDEQPVLVPARQTLLLCQSKSINQKDQPSRQQPVEPSLFTQQPFHISAGHRAGSAGQDGSPPPPEGHTEPADDSEPNRVGLSNVSGAVRAVTSRMWCSSVILDLLALVSVSLSRVLSLKPSAFPVWVP